MKKKIHIILIIVFVWIQSINAQYLGGPGSSQSFSTSVAGAVISGGTVTTLPPKVIIDGIVTFNGGAPTTVDTLVINPNSKLNLGGSGIDLVANGKIRIMADESGAYGQLRIVGSLNLNGGALVQEQYAATTGWRNMGVPLDGSSTVSVFGTVNGNAIGATANTKNIKFWDATTSSWQDVTASDQIVPGRGYNVYIGPFGVQPTPGFIEVEGTPNGSITPSLSYHNPGTTGGFTSGVVDGWNFLANPFAASLDFDAIFDAPNNPANVEQAYYIWDPNTNTYYTYAGAGAPGNTLTGFIPPLQGFWVRATAANPTMGTWSYQAHTVDTEEPAFLKTGDFLGHIVLDVKGVQEQEKQDQLTIALANESATQGFDNGADARKLMNPETSLNFYTYANKEALAINAIAMPHGEAGTTRIPVRLENTTVGKRYTIAIQPDYIPLGVKVYLEDAVEGTMNELSHTSPAYTYKANANQAERFAVWISSDLSWEPKPYSPELDAYVANNQLIIEPGAYEGNGSIAVFDVCGRLLYENSNLNLQAYTTTRIDLPKQFGGVTLVRLVTDLEEYMLKSAQ